MHEDALNELRAKAPLTHCITNYVAMSFAAMSAALTINIGTLSAPWSEGMLKAAKAANSNAKPWVLDPVAHFISPLRSHITQELMDLKLTIVRGNASEIIALGGAQSAGKGVDSGDSVLDARDAAVEIAQRYDTIVAITDETDMVTNGIDVVRINGRSDLMPMVTAMGYAQTVLIGAYAANADPFIAAQVAHFPQHWQPRSAKAPNYQPRSHRQKPMCRRPSLTPINSMSVGAMDPHIISQPFGVTK